MTRDRRQGDRRAPGLPVPVAAPVDEPKTHAAEPETGAEAAFSAQILGGPPRRGLKGGPETLSAARSTYLKTEYSGPSDRRPKPGRVTKTEA